MINIYSRTQESIKDLVYGITEVVKLYSSAELLVKDMFDSRSRSLLGVSLSMMKFCPKVMWDTASTPEKLINAIKQDPLAYSMIEYEKPDKTGLPRYGDVMFVAVVKEYAKSLI